MRKIVFAMLFASTFILAGGFVSLKSPSKSEAISSVKEALAAKDDEKVSIKGYIKKSLGDEKYEFRDLNGDSIIIEIDDDKWGGVSADEETLLEIYGEVDDNKFKKNEIDVKKLRLVK